MVVANHTKALASPNRLIKANNKWTHHNSMGNSSKGTNIASNNSQGNINNPDSNMVNSQIHTVVINSNLIHISHRTNNPMGLPADRWDMGKDNLVPQSNNHTMEMSQHHYLMAQPNRKTHLLMSELGNYL